MSYEKNIVLPWILVFVTYDCNLDLNVIGGSLLSWFLVIRPGVNEVKARLFTLGTEHVLTEEELGKLDKKSFLVYVRSALLPMPATVWDWLEVRLMWNWGFSALFHDDWLDHVYVNVNCREQLPFNRWVLYWKCFEGGFHILLCLRTLLRRSLEQKQNLDLIVWADLRQLLLWSSWG